MTKQKPKNMCAKDPKKWGWYSFITALGLFLGIFIGFVFKGMISRDIYNETKLKGPKDLERQSTKNQKERFQNKEFFLGEFSKKGELRAGGRTDKDFVITVALDRINKNNQGVSSCLYEEKTKIGPKWQEPKLIKSLTFGKNGVLDLSVKRNNQFLWLTVQNLDGTLQTFPIIDGNILGPGVRKTKDGVWLIKIKRGEKIRFKINNSFNCLLPPIWLVTENNGPLGIIIEGKVYKLPRPFRGYAVSKGYIPELIQLKEGEREIKINLRKTSWLDAKLLGKWEKGDEVLVFQKNRINRSARVDSNGKLIINDLCSGKVKLKYNTVSKIFDGGILTLKLFPGRNIINTLKVIQIPPSKVRLEGLRFPGGNVYIDLLTKRDGELSIYPWGTISRKVDESGEVTIGYFKKFPTAGVIWNDNGWLGTVEEIPKGNEWPLKVVFMKGPGELMVNLDCIPKGGGEVKILLADEKYTNVNFDLVERNWVNKRIKSSKIKGSDTLIKGIWPGRYNLYIDYNRSIIYKGKVKIISGERSYKKVVLPILFPLVFKIDKKFLGEKDAFWIIIFKNNSELYYRRIYEKPGKYIKYVNAGQYLIVAWKGDKKGKEKEWGNEYKVTIGPCGKVLEFGDSFLGKK